eukprot:gene4286-35575_t
MGLYARVPRVGAIVVHADGSAGRGTVPHLAHLQVLEPRLVGV